MTPQDDKWEEVNFDKDELELIEEQIVVRALSYEMEGKPRGSVESEPLLSSELLWRIRLLRTIVELEDRIQTAKLSAKSLVDEQILNYLNEHSEEDSNSTDREIGDEKIVSLQNFAREALVINRTSNHIFLLITLVSEIVSLLSIKLIKLELISEEYAKSSDSLLENSMNQEIREDLMLRTGVINQSLQSELSHIRKFRNRLVHDIDNRVLFHHTNNIFSEVNRSLRSLDDLHERVYGYPFFADFKPFSL